MMFDFAITNPQEVVEALGMGENGADEQDYILARVQTLLNERVGIRVESGLTDKELQRIAQLGDDRQAVQKFITETVPDIATIYEEELAEIVEQVRQDLDLA